ncbi:MAG TPA: hypothetical protein VLC09_19130, partial [Polyangiaceae bacterium]|nr:hypothetical protein [Polyangiaceae bacterium]
GASGGAPGGGFVEDDGLDCAVGTLPESAALPTVALLPDPFTRLDGSMLSKKSDWRCRRQELRRQAEKYVFGTKPAKPAQVSGEIASNRIDIDVSNQGKSASFSVSVELPSGAGPFPVLISLGGGGFGFSHNGLVKAEGVAIIHYDPYAVGSEAGTRQNKQGAFYTLYGARSSTGLLAAWAWGVSRILDVLEQSDGSLLTTESVAVAGCSRFGKGALAVGAFDQRIALTIPFESGSGGVPSWRGIPGEGAQSPGSAYGETYWLGDAFGSFTSGVTKLPIDTHEVLGMIAPRGLLVLDNPHIANLGPRSAHVAALAAAEIYGALGARENIGYHSAVADGGHCSARPEHQEPLRQALRKFLLGTGSQAGTITAAAKATGNLATWRSWTTPTLL